MAHVVCKHEESAQTMQYGYRLPNDVQVELQNAEQYDAVSTVRPSGRVHTQYVAEQQSTQYWCG